MYNVHCTDKGHEQMIELTGSSRLWGITTVGHWKVS